jgi:hypothetical protein
VAPIASKAASVGGLLARTKIATGMKHVLEPRVLLQLADCHVVARSCQLPCASQMRFSVKRGSEIKQ